MAIASNKDPFGGKYVSASERELAPRSIMSAHDGVCGIFAAARSISAVRGHINE
jgi:hypothetical protein